MRRIRVACTTVYQVRPSFVMPYQIGLTQDVAKGLYMYFSGASFDQVVQNHGRDELFWYRALVSLGRNALVGTTVKNPSYLPEHLLADEKHTKWYNEPVYLATTVGDGCFLGAALAREATEAQLLPAYREFETEARSLRPDYQPQTVNTDGWGATRTAWQKLFDRGVVLILCFLHAALKIRDRCRRWEKKRELMKRVWSCYLAPTLTLYREQVQALEKWTLETPEMPEGAREKVLDLCVHPKRFEPGYSHLEAHHTSNMLDRLMDFQDRILYGMRYLHSYALQGTARLMVRAMALLWNFHPFGRKTGRHSPFADLNGLIYHPNWLENLMIAASLGGRR
jgi:hypothetical protein